MNYYTPHETKGISSICKISDDKFITGGFDRGMVKIYNYCSLSGLWIPLLFRQII